MTIKNLVTAPIAGQKPGTSGLRKKTAVFQSPHFLENYVQSIFDGIGGVAGKRFVIGGDGRFFNRQAIDVILRMAAANGVAECIVGRDGLLSTPAASHLIRLNGTNGGLILSASHNPGGPNADFGLKFNGANGGPASEAVTEEIYACTQNIEAYKILEAPTVDLSVEATTTLGDMTVTVIDPVSDYAELMESLFDFDAIRAMFEGGFRMVFDSMLAVTGPYAKEIFETRLGAKHGTVINGEPSHDFGGGHPDPNPIWARELMAIMQSDTPPDFGAASDGDGDRNMITGPHRYVSPSDSLAILADLAHLAPAYKGGLAGVARSMPTSCAVDRVAAAKGMESFETPTGWKFFGNLLDAGRVTLCGEESAGTGSDHVREKDGLWAVLLWLNIFAATGKSMDQILADHYATYGRTYYSRHDFEAVETENANALMDALRAKLPDLAGQEVNGLRVQAADEFAYDDPVDGSRSERQGLRILFEGGARAIFRLSGTDTEGATLRVYLERLETAKNKLKADPQKALANVIASAETLAEIKAHTGRAAPDVIT
ncbi:alpha-D-glucose phosphate-specific phosphoglucomutase [Cognatishimia sp.]|uniref:alpha-D-glucose phosphate-specific phosphoglucomutase n=1 Tax=Cognatishimia sp. TaxID=2211648 RepID=UPI00351593E0|nr:alpha-D-glucose phosphate-specific phosphoglucomutase [Cognatishimia sp.]